MQVGFRAEIFLPLLGWALFSLPAAGACEIDNLRTSADRAWTVFESASSDCVAGMSGEQVYAKEAATGKTVVVSSSLAGLPGDAFSHLPVISADNLYVYFQSNSTNLVPNGDNLYRIYRKNLKTAKVDVLSTTTAGKVADGASFRAEVNADGRFLFFESVATNLVPDTHGYQVYRKDLQSGAVLLVSADSKGVPGDGSSGHPSSSEDGERVAFMSRAKNLVAGVSGNQIYAKDLTTGKVALISADGKNTPANGFSTAPTISPGATSVTFLSTATNWAAFPNPKAIYRTYRKNRETGELERPKLVPPVKPIKSVLPEHP